MIKVVLWDLDNTLLDFPAAERVALRQTFADFSLGFCTEEQIARFSVLNLSWWKRLERGEITKAQLLPGRFQEFFQAEGVPCTAYEDFNAAYQDHLGAEKPSLDFFRPVLQAIGPYDKQELLLIGDSLTSDMEGGRRAGIPCCWYNPAGAAAPADLPLRYEIRNLNQVRQIVAGN